MVTSYEIVTMVMTGQSGADGRGRIESPGVDRWAGHFLPFWRLFPQGSNEFSGRIATLF